MRQIENIEKRIKNANIVINVETNKKIFNNILQAFKRSKAYESVATQPNMWRNIMKNKNIRFATAIAAAIAVILGVSIYLPSSSDSLVSGQWWLGSSTAWGQEIMAELEKIKGVTCRERTLILSSDGSEYESRTWDKFYVSEDSYRRDIHDGDELREVQWYVPNAEGKMIQTGFRHDTKSYFTCVHEGGFGKMGPVARMRFYVELLDMNDKLFGTEEIDGRECVGFEISANKYGDNPPEWFDRIWFDVETKLPVRIEKHGHYFTGRPDLPYILVMDQFDYNPDLPADFFEPWYPKGYIYGHPDDIRKDEDTTEF